MKTDRRRDLRHRLRRRFTSPHSGITYVLRTLHEADWISLWNECYSPRAIPSPRTASIDVDRHLPENQAAERSKPPGDQLEIFESKVEPIYRRVSEDAARDLTALGIKPTPIMIRAYWYRMGSWASLSRIEDETLTALTRDLAIDAPQGCREYLRISNLERESVSPQEGPVLNEKQYRAWSLGVRDIVRARLLHDRALEQRSNYVLLRHSKSMPSRDAFFACYYGLSAMLIEDGGSVDRLHYEVILGFSAAEASSWNLRTISFQLQEFDLELNPKESYSSLRSPPKQLGVWKEIGCRLKRALPPSMSSFGMSKSIAAAMLTYAGPPFFAAASVTDFAKDTVEKWLREDAASDEETQDASAPRPAAEQRIGKSGSAQRSSPRRR